MHYALKRCWTWVNDESQEQLGGAAARKSEKEQSIAARRDLKCLATDDCAIRRSETMDTSLPKHYSISRVCRLEYMKSSQAVEEEVGLVSMVAMIMLA